MEENAGTVSDGVAEAPFSELISRWLDEGDRLNENVAAAASVASSRGEGPLRRGFSRLREVVARHRLFVLAGVGLLPLALLVATQRVSPPPAIAASMVYVISPPPPASSTPSAASLAPSPRPAVSAARVAADKPRDHRPVKHRRRHHLVLRDRGKVQISGSPSPRARASAH